MTLPPAEVEQIEDEPTEQPPPLWWLLAAAVVGAIGGWTK